MQYISPFSLLGISIDEISKNADSLNVSFLRKKMLAEFELSNSVTIETASGELSKNDVLVVLDQLQDPEVLKYHLQIAKDRILLEFLESNCLEGSFQDHPIYLTDGFLKFISPYFAHSYCALIGYMFDTEGASNSFLYRAPLLLTRGEEHIWLQPVRRQILDLVSQIEKLIPVVKSKNNSTPGEIFNKIYGYNVLRILNAIDYTVFEHDIEAYVMASLELVNSCINDKNTGFRNEEIVLFVLKRIEILRMDKEYKNRVLHFLAFVKRDSSAIVEEREGPSVFRVIYILILLLGLLARLANACH